MCFYGPVSFIKKILPTGSQKSCLLILGLDNAGKSTLTDRLAEIFNGDSKESNNQVSEWSFTLNNSRVQLWDINGELKNRQIWPKYYKKVKVLIFVLDSTDAVRLSEARCVLCDVLMHQELDNVPLLIVSNKKDASGSLSMSTVIDLMGLYRLTGRDWTFEECSMRTGSGVQEIVNWINEKIKNNRS
ncbi:ADP-ribosylation factor-like protein 3 [Drosophila sechellia]|uniref:ADP-ribosylation factor-related protein 1 n=1 Tax=Drosophila sechellia TaxID=7238 RepID=B4HM64_DROSE|nr:ADP-ribosylation factor-like protein 3 [Drosophila sechellia]EDW43112.1 GM23683 [Drosophila sechellia]